MSLDKTSHPGRPGTDELVPSRYRLLRPASVRPWCARRSRREGARPLRGRLISGDTLSPGIPKLLFITAFIASIALAANASAAEIKSGSRIAVGPGNVLFLADWKDAKVHALTLPGAP